MEDRDDHNYIVRRLFSNYKVPYELGAWEKFEKKRQRQRRLIVWYKAAGLAASISLIALVVLLRNESLPDATQENVVSHQPIEKEDNFDQTASNTAGKGRLNSNETLPPENFVAAEKANDVKKTTKQKSVDLTLDSSSSDPINNDEAVENSTMYQAHLLMEKLAPLGVSLMFLNPAVPSLANSEFDAFPEEAALINTLNLEEIKSEINKTPVVFGIALSSLVSSSSETSSSQPGISGGITMEIPFINKLAIYTGIHLANQTLTNEVNENPTLLTGSKALQSVATEFLSMDIPVNLKYTFTDRKYTAIYLVAGISSLAYLAETTESDFLVPGTKSTFQEAENGELIEVYETIQMLETEVNESEAFEQFDIVGQLNLSVGYSYKLNKQLRLIAEPYYKHPLSKLGSSGLSYSTVGVNLRLNFGRKK